MARALTGTGIRSTLAQQRSFYKQESLRPSDKVTKKQLKAFYVHCRPAKTRSSRSGSPKRSSRRGRDEDDDEDDSPPKEGDKVEGNFKGGGKWYPGVVERVWRSGLIDVLYDDGERERKMVAENVRKLGGKGKGKGKGGGRGSESEGEGELDSDEEEKLNAAWRKNEPITASRE